jgi:hypothetical protein
MIVNIGGNSMTIQSNAQSNRWYAVIQGMPEVECKLTDFTLPMMSAGTIDLGGGGKTRLELPGDRISFDELQINFLVDKEYRNYESIYKWLLESTQGTQAIYKNIDVHLLDNQGRPQNIVFRYIDAWPIMMAPIMLDAEGSVTDIVMGITVKYTDFEIGRCGS